MDVNGLLIALPMPDTFLTKPEIHSETASLSRQVIDKTRSNMFYFVRHRLMQFLNLNGSNYIVDNLVFFKSHRLSLGVLTTRIPNHVQVTTVVASESSGDNLHADGGDFTTEPRLHAVQCCVQHGRIASGCRF